MAFITVQESDEGEGACQRDVIAWFHEVLQGSFVRVLQGLANRAGFLPWQRLRSDSSENPAID